MNQAIFSANKLNRLLPVLALLGTPLAAQFQQQARMVLATPLKVAVKPPPQGARAGDPMAVAVQFQDGRDQPAALHEESGVELQLLGPKGEIVQKTSCKIRAGTPEATCKVTAPKPGLYKVRALPANHELLEGTGYVLVRPDAAPERRTPQRELPLKNKAWWSRPSFLIPVGYQPEPPPPAAPTAATCGATRSAAKVLLLINDGGETGGAFRAGLDTAKIQAFFAADDGGAAPVDIKIWLTPDHGTIDLQPLVLSKCGVSAEAHLSSNFVGRATVHYAVAPATFKVEATPTLQASFVRPIIGIGIVPNGPQTLSLIDTVPVVAQFFDIDGNVVPTDSERTVTFVSNNSIISPKQQRITLKAGEASAQTMILPFWLGKGSLFVSADRLKTASHDVQVVGEMVFLVCLLGGVAGGLVLFFVSGGSWYSRVFVGVVAGIVLSWAYVFGVLPNVDSIVAHNYLSVFVVSILGGYLGIKALDVVLKRFGWSS